MADHGTAIEWTQAPGYKGETWNPVTGCDRVSPGCAHCYALELAARLKGMGQKRYQVDGDPKTSGPGFGITLHPDKLEQPLRWTKPRMVFVNSMSDLFHEAIPDEYIDRVFAVMAATPQHIFQVLTKRPERMAEVLRRHHGLRGAAAIRSRDGHFPLPNVWLGVTIENRRFVHRADLLRQTPAAVRFISAEPLLGPLVPSNRPDPDRSPVEHRPGRARASSCATRRARTPGSGEGLDLTSIDWLIVGGESGAKHRRIDPEWVRDLRNVCTQPRELGEPGTAFFFKQWGGATAKAGGRELDGRTWSEWPAALGVGR